MDPREFNVTPCHQSPKWMGLAAMEGFNQDWKWSIDEAMMRLNRIGVYCVDV